MQGQYGKRLSLNYFDPGEESRTPPVPCVPSKREKPVKEKRRTSLLEIAQRVSVGNISSPATASGGISERPRSARRGSKVKWLSKSDDISKGSQKEGRQVAPTLGSEPEIDLTSANLGYLSLLYKKSLNRKISEISDIDSPATTRRNFDHYLGNQSQNSSDTEPSTDFRNFPQLTGSVASLSRKSLQGINGSSTSKSSPLSAQAPPKAPVPNVIVVKRRPSSARLGVSLGTAEVGQRMGNNSRSSNRRISQQSMINGGPTQQPPSRSQVYHSAEPSEPISTIVKKVDGPLHSFEVIDDRKSVLKKREASSERSISITDRVVASPEEHDGNHETLHVSARTETDDEQRINSSVLTSGQRETGQSSSQVIEGGLEPAGSVATPPVVKDTHEPTSHVTLERTESLATTQVIGNTVEASSVTSFQAVDDTLESKTSIATSPVKEYASELTGLAVASPVIEDKLGPSEPVATLHVVEEASELSGRVGAFQVKQNTTEPTVSVGASRVTGVTVESSRPASPPASPLAKVAQQGPASAQLRPSISDPSRPPPLRRSSSAVRFSVVEDAKMDFEGDLERPPNMNTGRRMSMYSYTSADYVEGQTERDRELEELREQLQKTLASAAPPVPPDISPDSDYNSHSSNQQSGHSSTSSGSSGSDSSSESSSSYSSSDSSRESSKSRKSRRRTSRSRSRKPRSRSRKPRSRSRKSKSRTRKSQSRGRPRSQTRTSRDHSSSSGSSSGSGSETDNEGGSEEDRKARPIDMDRAHLGDPGQQVQDGAFLLEKSKDSKSRHTKSSSVCVIL